MVTSYLRGSRSMTIDTSEFDRLKARLTGDELNKSAKSGLRKASRLLVAETERRFKHLVVKHKGQGKGALTGLSWRGRRKAVATNKIFDGKRGLQPMATVSIRNRRTDFRAHFFELGTKQRRTRKAYKVNRGAGQKPRYYRAGLNRGKIMEGRYFRRAQQASQAEVFRIMRETINGHIIRQANRR